LSEDEESDLSEYQHRFINRNETDRQMIQMVIGVGTDILSTQRIRNILEGDSEAFIRASFTTKEKEEASGRDAPVAYYATRFAGKEAVFKCFGIDGSEIKLNEIEILGSETEQPKVTLLGKTKEIAVKKGVKDVRISLSYETAYAVAFAIALG
jgi:phosphopantetheine--protein transferase-like protein